VNPYAAAARFRRRFYAGHPDRQRRLARPVVSIGNIAAGGRAKTPLVARVAALLRDAGERPSILSRGYARQDPDAGVVVVRDPDGIRADLARAGDEPLMLARQLEGVAVLVCRDRHTAGRLAERHFGCTVHVLDDGFQHLTLHRDVDVVLVAREDLDRPLTFPRGRLREPLEALGDADAIVALDGVDVRRLGASGPVFAGRRVMEPPRIVDAEPGQDAAQGAAVAVAGIAHPDQFFAGLRAMGWPVARELAYRDHHAYTRQDVRRILDVAHQQGAGVVVTTEKDLVRLLPFRPLGVHLAVAPFTVAMEDESGFARWLADRLLRAREGAA